MTIRAPDFKTQIEKMFHYEMSESEDSREKVKNFIQIVLKFYFNIM